MLNSVFSFQFIGITFVLITLSIGLAYLCTFLQKQLLYIAAGEWLLEHIYCPVGRVLMLILMVFLLMPMMQQQQSYTEISQLFFETDFLISMMNILFLSSLVFSFLPLLSHPALGMPILGCMSTALFFQYSIVLPESIEFDWLPEFDEVLKLMVLALILYFLTNWLNNKLSEWADHRFIVTGSKEIISDINFLIFQIPIILAYGQTLALQGV